MQKPLVLALLVWLVVSTGELPAQVPAWRPHTTSSPIMFGSLRSDPVFALAPAAGTWDVDVTVSQFNMWAHTWHTFALHRETNRYRLGVSDEELDQIERNFAEDYAYHLDVEGWRTDAVFARGFANDVAVIVRVPWIEIGSPRLDAFAESVHDSLDAASMQREVFARDDTLVYVKDRDNRHIIRAGRELERSGPGDVTVALGIPLRERWRAERRVAIAAEIPTGKRGTLQGSGGLDVNVTWFALWRGDRTDTKLVGGLTALAGGEFLGERRTEVLPHLAFEVDRRFFSTWTGSLAVRLDGSPLFAITDARLGYPPLFYRLGVARSLGNGRWIGFEVGEELKPQTGVEADWSFHLTYGSS